MPLWFQKKQASPIMMEEVPPTANTDPMRPSEQEVPLTDNTDPMRPSEQEVPLTDNTDPMRPSEQEVPPTDNKENQHEITLKEYIAGKRLVPGLESWADAVRNGRGPITIFGILQPIIGVLIAIEDEIVNVDLATTNRTSNPMREIIVVVYPLDTGLRWWQIRDSGTLPRTRLTEDSSTITGNVWSFGCILFEFCTGQRFATLGSSIPFHDGFDASSRKFFNELIHGTLCIDDNKRLSMDDFCNKLGGVVLVMNSKFVLPKNQSASPIQFYFSKQNWIGTEIKQMLHSPRIEHLLPSRNTVEENENLLKRRRSVVNARKTLLGVDHSATRTSVEIYGWTLFFMGQSQSAVNTFTRLLEGAESNTRPNIKEGIAWGKSNLGPKMKAIAMDMFTALSEDSANKDLLRYSALVGRAVLKIKYGEYKSAVEDLERTVSGFQELFSDKSLYLSEALMDLGVARIYLKEYESAKQSLEAALKIIRVVAGPNHSDVFLIKQKLGEIALDTQDFDTAVTLLGDALEGHNRAFGERDPDTQETVELLNRAKAARVSATTTEGPKKRSKSTAMTGTASKKSRTGR